MTRDEEEQAALLSFLEPGGAPQWALVSDIDGWALRAAAKAIAHDLREPILGVRRLAGWLAELAVGEAKDEAARYSALLDERLMRLEDRYDALRRFIEAGIGGGEQEPCDLGELCSQAAARTGTTRAVRIEVTGATSISAIRAPFERCLSELIANAIYHHDSDEIAIRVELAERMGSLAITVEDDGPGVSEVERERVFEPFVGTRTGMGLAIVRRTAALHGGWCELKARQGGRGTRAVLTWPV